MEMATHITLINVIHKFKNALLFNAFLRFEGHFHGASVYSSPVLKNGRAFSAGAAIFIGTDKVWNNPQKHFILQHEYGHYLQYIEFWKWKYIFRIAIPSLCSAFWNKPFIHNKKSFEMDANRRAFRFFNEPQSWNFYENPVI
jgi:hypothetical protein